MHKAISFVHVFKFIFENHYNEEKQQEDKEQAVPASQ
jgi:hypothetical protein